jgi:uncharacterized repeat protein (TIGR01451 family)
MNKIIKKVVYFVAIAIFLSVGNSVSASFPFNSDPADCPTISVGNYNTGVGVPTGGSTGCQNWSLDRVDAEAGDTINVHIYYHNTSSAPANDVKVNLVQSNTGPSTSFSISGTLASKQGNTAMGPVTVNLNSAQTLTFLNLAWFPNQTALSNTPTALPGGQSGSSIMGGGVNIGDVGNTKPAYQGNFVASFRVGNKTVINPPPNPTCQVSFSASPSYVTSSGQQVMLNWISTGASSVTITGGGITYTGGPSGSYQVFPSATTTYYITANCNNGLTSNNQTQVVYNSHTSQVCEINRFDANPTRITYSGQAVTLRWETTDADYVIVDGDRDYRSSGSVVVYPTRDTTYRIVAYCDNGVQLDRDVRVRADVNEELDLTTNRPTSVSETSATLNGYIDANGNNATRWFRYGTSTSSMNMTTNTVNHGSGAKNVSDTVYNLSPNTTYYYQVVASDIDGTHYNANIQSFVTNASTVNNGSTSAVTTIASNISRSGAQLNGLLINSSGLTTSTYFEYGTNVSMTNRTTSKAMGAGTSLPLSDYITGLAPNTIYYFRANAENSNGRVFGSIEIFRTNANAAPVTPTVITRVGTESPIMLKIENRYEIFRIGDLVDYTVTYKNIGSSTLTNPLLQVVLPQHVAYTNSSRGTYAAESHTLNVQLETLTPGAEGVVYLQGRVISLPTNRAQIVTTALLNYTNPNGAQEDAMAYVLNRDDINFNNNLSANALFAGGFMPDTLCGWLLLFIIILLIAWMIRWLLGAKDRRENKNNHYN